MSHASMGGYARARRDALRRLYNLHISTTTSATTPTVTAIWTCSTEAGWSTSGEAASASAVGFAGGSEVSSAGLRVPTS
eukprot:scaffold25055_cov106-Isochrysis_galbana.AAC.9